MNAQEELLLLNQQLLEYQTARGAINPLDRNRNDEYVALEVAIYDTTSRVANLEQALRVVTCVICMEDVPRADAMRGNCTHSFCGPCYRNLFIRATTHEAENPAKCCNQEIPACRTKGLLTSAERTAYSNARKEFATEDRLYCANAPCNWFIKPELYAHKLGALIRCGKCYKLTCQRCKGIHGHNDIGPREPETERIFREMCQNKGWSRCPRCQVVVELTTGCNHMT
jgi:hypothetical protein